MAVSQGTIYRPKGRNDGYWKFRWNVKTNVTALGTTSTAEASRIEDEA